MSLHEIYLRTKTSVGTMRLPLVREEAEGDDVILTFNWIVFEKDVTVYSIQPFAEVGTPDPDPDFPQREIIEHYEIGKKVKMRPSSGMRDIPGCEVGCFQVAVPLAFLRELDPAYEPGVLA